MQTAPVAALIAVLVLGFVEGLRRFYPSRSTWLRMRRARGRRPMMRMRERYETGAGERSYMVLAILLLILMGTWIATASLLDKRWHEVVFDVLPYVFVGIAILRTPGALREIAKRMKDFEQEVGDDKFVEDNGPPGAIPI